MANVVSRMSQEQAWLDDDLMYWVDKGDLSKVKGMVEIGADVMYENPNGYNALFRAIEFSKFDIAKYLLELGMKNDKRIVGGALICATTPEAIKLLAEYEPDCSVQAPNGFAAVDWFVFDKDYCTLKAYDDCGLVRPPINPKVIREANKKQNIRQLAAALNVPIEEELCMEFEREVDWQDPYVEKRIKERKNRYNRLKREMIANAKPRESAV